MRLQHNQDEVEPLGGSTASLVHPRAHRACNPPALLQAAFKLIQAGAFYLKASDPNDESTPNLRLHPLLTLCLARLPPMPGYAFFSARETIHAYQRLRQLGDRYSSLDCSHQVPELPARLCGFIKLAIVIAVFIMVMT